MKTPKIADFREKVVLLKASVTVDDELNRVETVAPVKECWAAVEVKSTSIENTPAGTRPEIKYLITLRKQRTRPDFDYVKFREKVLQLAVPWYEYENKYIIIEAVESVGKRCIITEFSQGCRLEGAESGGGCTE